MTTLDLAKEWLRYAKSDLNTANHMFKDVHPKETEISCYHAQQCAEKSLKACLIAMGTTPPYTHDLVELISWTLPPSSSSVFSSSPQSLIPSPHFGKLTASEK